MTSLQDMIISGGDDNYFPEVERVLAEHPAGTEVTRPRRPRCIGVPDDERWGRTVKAVVSLHPRAPYWAVRHCRTV